MISCPRVEAVDSSRHIGLDTLAIDVFICGHAREKLWRNKSSVPEGKEVVWRSWFSSFGFVHILQSLTTTSVCVAKTNGELFCCINSTKNNPCVCILVCICVISVCSGVHCSYHNSHNALVIFLFRFTLHGPIDDQPVAPNFHTFSCYFLLLA